MSRMGGEARRRVLITAAMKSFGTYGYGRTTLDEVSSAAGVVKQTLLYYFPSKEELFQACVDEFAAEVASALEQVLEDSKEGWERVEAVIRGIFRMAEHNPDLPRFAREAARSSPEIVQQVAAMLEPLRKRALEFLERGMAEGLFRSQDPGLLLFTLYTAVVGSLTEAGVLRAVSGGETGRTALKQREEELVEFVRRALAP